MKRQGYSPCHLLFNISNKNRIHASIVTPPNIDICGMDFFYNLFLLEMSDFFYKRKKFISLFLEQIPI